MPAAYTEAFSTPATVHRPAWGTNNGVATVSIFVDNNPMPVTMVDTQGLNWRATLELPPGAHQLRAEALHPSTLFTAYATNTITASATNNDITTTVFDLNGDVTVRIWKNGSTTNRIQTLIWDAAWEREERGSVRSVGA